MGEAAPPYYMVLSCDIWQVDLRIYPKLAFLFIYLIFGGGEIIILLDMNNEQ